MSSELDRGWGYEFEGQPGPEEDREEPEAADVEVPEVLPTDEEETPRWDADTDADTDADEDLGFPCSEVAGVGPTDGREDGGQGEGATARKQRLATGS